MQIPWALHWVDVSPVECRAKLLLPCVFWPRHKSRLVSRTVEQHAASIKGSWKPNNRSGYQLSCRNVQYYDLSSDLKYEYGLAFPCVSLQRHKICACLLVLLFSCCGYTVDVFGRHLCGSAAASVQPRACSVQSNTDPWAHETQIRTEATMHIDSSACSV
jgi:hypothetical protein